MQVPVPVRPWVGSTRTHTADRNRAEDSLAYASDNPDIRGCLRDWNEEFQSCKELPKTDILFPPLFVFGFTFVSLFFSFSFDT